MGGGQLCGAVKYSVPHLLSRRVSTWRHCRTMHAAHHSVLNRLSMVPVACSTLQWTSKHADFGRPGCHSAYNFDIFAARRDAARCTSLLRTTGPPLLANSHERDPLYRLAGEFVSCST